ncbi:MAG: hypothetical protein CMK59_12465 [Proteobacteria bacterium]|nr:hypothetical protein [Pseudomonadota bacterium]
MKTQMKKIKGDRLSIYICPPGTSFPWIKLYDQPYGLKGPQYELDTFDVRKGKTQDEVAKELGELLLQHSPVLKKWFDTLPQSNPKDT